MRERKGHRKLSRKYYENKYFPKKLLVSIPRRAVCILKVSLPVNLVSFRVSLPISAFSESPVASLDILHNRMMLLRAVPQSKSYALETTICNLIYLSDWNYHIKDGVLSIYQLCILDKGPVIMLSLTIKKDFSWVVRFQKQPLILQNMPSCINSGINTTVCINHDLYLFIVSSLIHLINGVCAIKETDESTSYQIQSPKYIQAALNFRNAQCHYHPENCIPCYTNAI